MIKNIGLGIKEEEIRVAADRLGLEDKEEKIYFLTRTTRQRGHTMKRKLNHRRGDGNVYNVILKMFVI